MKIHQIVTTVDLIYIFQTKSESIKNLKMLIRKFIILVFVGVFAWGLIEAALPRTINILPYTFKALDRHNRTMIKYSIKILPWPKHNEALEFLAKYYHKGLATLVAFGMC